MNRIKKIFLIALSSLSIIGGGAIVLASNPVQSQILSQFDQFPKKFLQGYQQSISGEVIHYHSANEYINDALLVRTLDGTGKISWLTESTSKSATDSTSTFVWMAGLAGSKGVHSFELSVDDRPTLQFASAPDSSQKILHFTGKNGVSLTFIVTMVDQFSDLFGYMILRIPTQLLLPGKPVRLSVTGAAEGSTAWFMTFQSDLVQRVRTEALPLLVTHGDSTLQLIKVGIEHYGPTTEFIVRADSKNSIDRSIGWGAATCMFPVPAVSKPESITVTVESDGRIVRTDTILIKPVRKRVLYLLPHSHTDIGYSDYQTVVEENHIKYIDDGIRLAQQTSSYPEGSRFKWNIEVLWPLESYLRRATTVQRDSFVDAVKKGYIGLNAFYANDLTGLCRPEELIHLTDFARWLTSQFGLDVNAAMISDIPAYTSSTVTALGLSGVKYLSSGPNYMPTLADGGDRIGYALKAWGDRPFYWKSKSGQEKILFWMAGRGYSWFHGLGMGRLKNASLSTICRYLDELDAKDYPYDIVQVRYTMGDNAGVDPDLSDCVKAWNEQYASPKMVIATTQEMFEAFERKYADKLQVLDGDFTPYWEDGAVSTAREQAENRNAAERLVQIQALDAMIDPSRYDSAKFYTAWRDVVLWDEHTWGAYNSISEPDSPNVIAQWKYKKNIIEDGVRYTDALLQNAEGPILDPSGSRAIDIFNTSSWPRTDVVIIPNRYSESADRVTTAGGKEIVSQRLAGGDLAVLVRDVPAFGGIRLYLSKGSNLPKTTDLNIEQLSIENDIIRLAVDSLTGSISSFQWKGRELVDTARGAGLNQYFYVPGYTPDSAQTDHPTSIAVQEHGPLIASLLVKSFAPGTNSLRREIRIFRGIDRVDIIDSIDKKSVRNKEAVHIGFPFRVPNGLVRLDNGWEVIQPGKEQLAGSCMDYFSVQRWVDVSNDKFGITLTNPDAPLVEVGSMTNEARDSQGHRVWKKTYTPAQNIFSYAMNNYWHTNYKADQSGLCVLRFSIVPHERYDVASSERIGMESSQPLLVVPADVKSKLPMQKFTVSPPSVIVTAFKPADDGNGFVLRLFNAGEDSVRPQIHWKKRGVSIYRSDVSEMTFELLRQSAWLPRFGVETIRIKNTPR